MPLSLRPATDADALFLQELFGSTRPEFDLLPEPVRVPLLAAQFEARRRAYAASHPGSLDRIVEEDGRPVGRLLTHRAEGARTLVDVALLPDVRGRGIGAELVRLVLEESDGGVVRLSVVRDNPAARLYRRFGFVEVGGDAVYALLERSASA